MTEKQEREHVEGLYRLGYTAQEIAEELKWATKNPRSRLMALRKRGWDLPKRKGRWDLRRAA